MNVAGGLVRALGLVGAEDGHQSPRRPLGHVVDLQRAGETSGLAHLLEVGDAAVAEAEVVLERAALAGGQDALEVVGHELDELDAGTWRGARRRKDVKR